MDRILVRAYGCKFWKPTPASLSRAGPNVMRTHSTIFRKHTQNHPFQQLAGVYVVMKKTLYHLMSFPAFIFSPNPKP